MTENLVKRLKEKLNSELFFMDEVWLRGCIDFYFTKTTNPSDDELLHVAKQQWKLSDLNTINTMNGILPPNMAETHLKLLSGSYILQMDNMYDISAPKYKQLEQIRAVDSTNIDELNYEDISSELRSKKQGKRTKRMMQLHLTDGIQKIFAVEYKPIPLFDVPLYPGTKIILTGPIECRRGVLLLEPKNIQDMGGEVDAIARSNAIENVLARAMSRPENPLPHHDNFTHPEHLETAETTENLFEDDFQINFDELTQIEHAHQDITSAHPGRSGY